MIAALVTNYGESGEGSKPSSSTSALERDLGILVQLRPAVQDWNASVAPLVADVNDESVTAGQWVARHTPTIEHLGTVVAGMGIIASEGSPTAVAFAQPYVEHYEIELAALEDLRDAWANGDQSGADSALDRLIAEAPRARELGCQVIPTLKHSYPDAAVDRMARARSLDKLCA